MYPFVSLSTIFFIWLIESIEGKLSLVQILILFDFKLLRASFVNGNSSNNLSQIILILFGKVLIRDDRIDCFSALIINFVKYFENFFSNSKDKIEIKSSLVSNELFSKILS